MTTAGTWYYPPCADTGNLLLANPPFIFDPMDTNQPNPAKGLPGLTEEQFQQLSVAAGGSGDKWAVCNYAHGLRIAQRAYQLGADAELEACCQWLEDNDGGDFLLQWAVHEMRTARRPKPPSLREQALAVLEDCNLDAAHENTIRRALADGGDHAVVLPQPLHELAATDPLRRQERGHGVRRVGRVGKEAQSGGGDARAGQLAEPAMAGR